MRKLMLMAVITALVLFVNGCQEAEQVSQEAVAQETPVVEDAAAEVAEEPTADAQEIPSDSVIAEAAEEPETVVQETEAVEDIVDADAVVVTINGQTVTEKEISEEVQKRMAGQKKRMPEGVQLPDSYAQQIRTRVVDSKIQQVLLGQQMVEQGLTVSDDQVLEEIEEIAGKKGQSMEQVEAEIAGYGMTLEDLKTQIRSQLQIMALIEKKQPIVVSEADVQKFYDENPQHFENKEQVKASHILCGKRGIKEEEYPAEKEKIEAALARLNAGEAFEDVAKDVSTCPSSSKGGDLGFFGKGQMDPAFEAAAFELQPGQTSGVVKSSFGYHIIKVTDKQEAGKKTIEDVREQITDYLTQQQQRQVWTEMDQAMRDAAVIEYSEKEQAMRDQMQKAAAAPKTMPVQPRTAPQPQPTE